MALSCQNGFICQMLSDNHLVHQSHQLQSVWRDGGLLFCTESKIRNKKTKKNKKEQFFLENKLTFLFSCRKLRTCQLNVCSLISYPWNKSISVPVEKLIKLPWVQVPLNSFSPAMLLFNFIIFPHLTITIQFSYGSQLSKWLHLPNAVW